MGGALLIKEAHHPFWELRGPAEARLETLPLGLMQVAGLPPGRHALQLRYSPPAFPFWLTVVGLLGIAALALGRRRP